MPDKLSVKGIMFDLDGTILDTKRAYIETAKIAFQAVGQPFPINGEALEIPKRIEQMKSIGNIVKGDSKRFLEIYFKAFYEISPLKTSLFPKVNCTIEILSQNAILSVITMRFVPKSSIITDLKRFQLDKYFHQVVTGLDTDKPKPSPEAIFKATKAMGLSAHDCVIVGDSVVDVEAGKAAGTFTVAVLTGLYSRSELESCSPDFIINDVSELPRLLK